MKFRLWFPPRVLYRTDTVDLNAVGNAATTPTGGLTAGVTLSGYAPSDILKFSLPDSLTWIAWSPWGLPGPPVSYGHHGPGSMMEFHVIRDGDASDDTLMGQDVDYVAMTGLFGGYEAARAAFPGNGLSSISGGSSYTFYIQDNPVDDNSGGLSIVVDAYR